MSSSGRMVVRPGPREQVGERDPAARPSSSGPPPAASKQSSGPLVSAAGEALARLPPSVPTCRVAGEPTIDAASAMAVQRSRMAGWPASSAWLVVAPIRRPPSVSAIPRSSAIRSSATRSSGSDHLPCRVPTTRSVPPATGRCPAAAAVSASASVVGEVNRPPMSGLAVRRRDGVARPARASSAARGCGCRWRGRWRWRWPRASGRTAARRCP